MRLGAAIRDALERSGRTQGWLGAEVASREGRPDPFSQAIVSDWLVGKTGIPPQRVFHIESALGLKPSALSRIAGYVPADLRPQTTVAAALEADPDITPEQAEMVLAAYEAARKATRARRAKRSK